MVVSIRQVWDKVSTLVIGHDNFGIPSRQIISFGNDPNTCFRSSLAANDPTNIITVYIDALRQDTNDSFTLFNGRNGMELVDSLRAGCHGLIPGVDACDRQVAIYEAFVRGDEAEADRAFAEILPLLLFLMHSIDHLLCYGKRLTARRLDLGAVHDRTPAQQQTDFGLEIMNRLSKDLGNF